MRTEFWIKDPNKMTKDEKRRREEIVKEIYERVESDPRATLIALRSMGDPVFDVLLKSMTLAETIYFVVRDIVEDLKDLEQRIEELEERIKELEEGKSEG